MPLNLFVCLFVSVFVGNKFLTYLEYLHRFFGGYILTISLFKKNYI